MITQLKTSFQKMYLLCYNTRRSMLHLTLFVIVKWLNVVVTTDLSQEPVMSCLHYVFELSTFRKIQNSIKFIITVGSKKETFSLGQILSLQKQVREHFLFNEAKHQSNTGD